MKGNETRLVEFMDGSKKRFVIPVYQRNYDWKQENCKQLFDDLVKVEKGGRRTHFFGSIVSVYQPSGRTTEFLVVDGQQRLTTVSLLLLAIYNLLKAGKVNSADSNLAQRKIEGLTPKNLAEYFFENVAWRATHCGFRSAIFPCVSAWFRGNKLGMSQI